jgi:hypothetical protein
MSIIKVLECTISVNKMGSPDHVLFRLAVNQGPYKPYDKSTTNCLRMEVERENGINYVVNNMLIDKNIIKIFDWKNNKKCSLLEYETINNVIF